MSMTVRQQSSFVCAFAAAKSVDLTHTYIYIYIITMYIFLWWYSIITTNTFRTT